MNKNTVKFEVSFNLNTLKGETLCPDSLKALQAQLYNFVQEWNGTNGYFYAYGSEYGDRDIDPTAIKVKRVKGVAC